MSQIETLLWHDGILGSNSSYTKLNTGNEAPSITWNFDPPLENVTHLNFSGLTGNWNKSGSNRSQPRIKAVDSSGIRVWSISGNHVDGARNTKTALKSLTYNMGGVQVASIHFARQKSRGISFSAVTTNQPTTASFTIMHTPSTPSIASIVTASNSMVITIQNPIDGLILSIGDLNVDVDDSEVIVDELDPNTTYNVILKST